MKKDDRCPTPDENLYSEWILTNRMGSYALGTGDLINTRKYHGLLVAAQEHLRRVHLVASVEEKIGVEGEFMFVDSASYVNTIYPHGYTHLVKTWLRPCPAFLFSTSPFSEHILIFKELFMDEERNITLLKYTNLGTVPFRYFFRYKFSLRDHHGVNQPGTFDYARVEHEAFEDGLLPGGRVTRADNGIRAFVYVAHGAITQDLVVYRNVFYPQEANRGYDALEDLVSPFIHEGYLRPGACTEVFLSDRSLADYGAGSASGFDALTDGIYARYAGFPLRSDHPSRADLPSRDSEGKKSALLASAGWRGEDFGGAAAPRSDGGADLLSDGDYADLLELMLDDFRSRDDIVAGFPWFSSWGRDTMIALKAFAVRRGMPRTGTGGGGPVGKGADGDFVSRVLMRYGEQIQGGLIPNVVSESEEGKNYDTVDASLWFVIRAFECFDSLPAQKRKKLFSSCEQIVLHYLFSRKLPFFWDAGDSLIELRSGTNLALTWMDAKIYGVPVTPRYGKPVEVNGLWFNAVKATARMASRLGRETLRCSGGSPSGEFSLAEGDLEEIGGQIAVSMKRFFTGDLWCDRIENGSPVPEIRPNYLIALSLPFDFADRESLLKGLSQAREHLLTPYGIRSLSPSSPMFRKWYIGNQKMRDMAYHQGTVWTWLLLPYAELLRKVIEDRRVLKEELTSLISNLKCGVRRGTLASIAEVWDGENPGVPKGAPVQALSVSALYCIEKMIEAC
jgi:glycogen debranching enzyme